MDRLSDMTPSISLSDIADAIDVDHAVALLDSVTPDFGGVSDAAVAVARRGRRLGLRTVGSTVHTVRRHPQQAAGIVAGLIALTAVILFLKKRQEKRAKATTTRVV